MASKSNSNALMRLPGRLALAITALVIFATLLHAQDRAGINGTVTDPSGQVIAGAKVELISTLNGFHRNTVTGTDGIYQFSSLAVGTYTVSISRDGFNLTRSVVLTCSSGKCERWTNNFRSARFQIRWR